MAVIINDGSAEHSYLQDLEERAALVGEGFHLQREAFEHQKHAEFELLGKVLVAVHQALPALASRIRKTPDEAPVGIEFGSTDQYLTTAEGKPFVGLLAAAKTVETRNPRIKINRRLYLTPALEWLVYSSPIGAPGGRVDLLDNAEVVMHWPFELILSRISEAIDQQINGGAAIRTDAARKKAARLRAIALLAGELKPITAKELKGQGGR